MPHAKEIFPLAILVTPAVGLAAWLRLLLSNNVFGRLKQGHSSYSSTQCHGRTYVWWIMAARLGYVQDDSQGNVSVLAGDPTGHREKKNHMNKCLILNGYRDRILWTYK
jgi:hypothetical protein